MVREGDKVRRARRRRHWTQRAFGRRAGVAQSTVSDLERGEGGTLSMELWQQICLLLDLPLNFSLGTDALREPDDAGHLGVQELVLRLGRRIELTRYFELPSKPANPNLSTDVGLTDDLNRRLIQVECVNTFGSINAAIRSADRKLAEAQAHAIAIGGEQPYAVHQVWVVRATRRNRALLERYPELFATRFTGSSKAWVDALTKGTRPPTGRGLVWCDVAATCIVEWRPRRRRVSRPEVAA